MKFGVLLITGGKTVTVQAASKMVALKADKTYTSSNGFDYISYQGNHGYVLSDYLEIQ